MSVTVGPKTYPNVDRGEDTTSYTAESYAKELYDTFGEGICVQANVHRDQGLILLFQLPDGTPFGHHLSSALAGYRGAGSIASAKILELFGFGTYDKIFGKISRGGDNAYFHFAKPVPDSLK